MNIEFTKKQVERIEELRKALDVKTKAEVIRRALQLLSIAEKNPDKAIEAITSVNGG